VHVARGLERFDEATHPRPSLVLLHVRADQQDREVGPGRLLPDGLAQRPYLRLGVCPVHEHGRGRAFADRRAERRHVVDDLGGEAAFGRGRRDALGVAPGGREDQDALFAPGRLCLPRVVRLHMGVLELRGRSAKLIKVDQVAVQPCAHRGSPYALVTAIRCPFESTAPCASTVRLDHLDGAPHRICI
jgi:hypothetical protein